MTLLGGKLIATNQLRNGVWSLGDQSVVSLGNFITQVVLARKLPPVAYGTFTLMYVVLLVLFTCQCSLITYPLSIRGAMASQTELRELTFGSILLTLAFTLPQALFVFGTAWTLKMPRLGWSALLALVLWQVQEAIRRAIMSRLLHRDAIWGDALSYLGQAAILWTLSRSGHLTLSSVFFVIAATSGASALLQGLQLGLSFISPRRIVALARDYWPNGRWALFNSLSETSFRQAFPWALAIISGPQGAASFQAAMNILGVSHPVLYGATNLIVPAAATANQQAGARAALRTCTECGAAVMALMAPYFAALLLWPQSILVFLYGKGSPYTALASGVRVGVVAYIFGIAGAVLTGYLLGVARSKRAFAANIGAGAIAVFPSVILIFRFGVTGAIAGLGVWLLARMVLDAVFVQGTICDVEERVFSARRLSPRPTEQEAASSGVAK